MAKTKFDKGLCFQAFDSEMVQLSGTIQELEKLTGSWARGEISDKAFIYELKKWIHHLEAVAENFSEDIDSIKGIKEGKEDE